MLHSFEQVAHAQHVFDAGASGSLSWRAAHQGPRPCRSGTPWRELRHSGGAKQVGQHGHAVARGLDEQQGGAAGARSTRSFSAVISRWGDTGSFDAAQLARGFELGHEVAVVHIFEEKVLAFDG